MRGIAHSLAPRCSSYRKENLWVAQITVANLIEVIFFQICRQVSFDPMKDILNLKIYNNDIGMQFGLNKVRKSHLENGVC